MIKQLFTVLNGALRYGKLGYTGQHRTRLSADLAIQLALIIAVRGKLRLAKLVIHGIKPVHCAVQTVFIARAQGALRLCQPSALHDCPYCKHGAQPRKGAHRRYAAAYGSFAVFTAAFIADIFIAAVMLHISSVSVSIHLF